MNFLAHALLAGDRNADRHPAFIASRARVSPLRRRVGGILVDLFYDHLLARDWAEHGLGTLENYAADLYAAIDSFTLYLPERGREVASLMRSHDWLCSYRKPEALAQAIDRMAVYRLRRANTLAGGIEEFLADPVGFDSDFRNFLPDAITFARNWRNEYRD